MDDEEPQIIKPGFEKETPKKDDEEKKRWNKNRGRSKRR